MTLLSKEQYYKRRWFLSILFLYFGLWLIYMAYGMFEYNKNKEDLAIGTEVPLKIFIEKSSGTDNSYLTLIFLNGKIGCVIEQYEKDKLKSFANLGKLIENEKPINSSLLNGFSFEYRYWKDRLYELKIDNNTIIEFKKGKNTIAYVIFIVGLFWTSFQGWVITTLITKGITVYDKAFKK